MKPNRTLSLFFFCFLGLFWTLPLPAQKQLPGQAATSCTEHHDHDIAHQRVGLGFIQNKGQWQDNIQFVAELGGLNHLFLEAGALTYVLHDVNDTEAVHEYMMASDQVAANHLVAGHAYRVQFVGSSPEQLGGEQPRKAFNNYFIGQDPDKWASAVPVFSKIRYQRLYPGIALAAYSQQGNFKYDFIVQPDADPGQIKLRYEGVDDVYLEAGNLVVETSVQTVTELAPYAYQLINGKREVVPCHYVLNGRELSFAFPKGYISSVPLVIDPTVIGATLSGTTGNQNFGHSATFDNAGNIYTAGISFGPGYPTTLGAFQTNFAGGGTDLAISKYNPEGSELIYATYIGGSGSDYPHSTVCDVDGNLVVYGSSTSSDYPTTANAFQPDHGGAFDIIVSKLNATGSALIGSTYIGGGADDGSNKIVVDITFSGDRYRGEVILDDQANVFISSCSSSSDFPVSANAFQSTFNTVGSIIPAQDAVVCRLTPDLSNLDWSTYLGGDGSDQGSGLRVKENGNVYVCGIAGGINFPMATGGQTANWPGGNYSAFVAEISADGSDMINGTFWGTPDEDYAYFIDTDQDDQVHIYGLTRGDMPITDDAYFFTQGSGQFLAAFDEDLSDLVYSTVIGSNQTGFDSYNFIPVAFMVDRCNGIYFSGYAADEGLPTTPDAVSTEGDAFYLAKLTPNATELTFGTYYGQANHVDGGTSRFDKAGIVYQAVCSCSFSPLTTTSNAYATTQSTTCDVGVFKIDFEVDVVTASAFAAPATSGCAPFLIDFAYTGEDATTVFWDFDDGESSDLFNPTHIFAEPGIYTVTQIVENLNSCNLRDTFYLEIEVFPSDAGSQFDVEYCVGDPGVLLDATEPGATYQWPDGSTGPTFLATEPGIYWVAVGSGMNLCPRVDSFLVTATSGVSVDLGADTVICDLTTYSLDASNTDAVNYQWQDGSTGASFEITSPGTYFVRLTDASGCQISDTVTVDFSTFPVFDLGPDIATCDAPPILLSVADEGFNYTWQDGSNGTTFNVQETGVYYLAADNAGCVSTDTISIDFGDPPQVEILSEDISCAGELDGSIDLTLTFSNGPTEYNWSNGQTGPNLTALPPGTYTVTVSDGFDCPLVVSVEIEDVAPITFATEFVDPICNDGIISIPTVAGGSPPYTFSFDGQIFSLDSTLANLFAGPYEVFVQDANGCLASTTLTLVDRPGISLDLGRDLSIRLGDSIRLNAQVSGLQHQSLRWSPAGTLSCEDCLTPFARPTANETYLLTVTDTTRGCMVTDEVAILVDRTRRVYIPNAFSPDNDGVNDLFYVFSDAAAINIKSFQIFDRWGSLLYEAFDIPTNEPRFGWNGIFNGKPMDSQVVVYAIEIEFLDGRTELFKGDVTILR